MYASELVKRARSLASIPKAMYIDHDDEVQSLWESYKDIYTKTTNAASFDYFLANDGVPTLLDMTTVVQTGPTEWLVSLPDDCWKLRYVDYNRNGLWQDMPLFNINQRNNLGGEPMYRWSGAKMWLIGSLPPQVRIRYYQPPQIPSVPDNAFQYALQYPIYELPGINQPQYFDIPDDVNEGNNDYCIYVLNGNTIMLESYSLNIEQILYTAPSGTLASALYWLGYVYFLQSGDVWRANTALTSLGVPTNLTNTGTVTNFSITANNKVVYSTSSYTYFANLDGSSPVVQWPYSTSDVCLFASGQYAYIKTSSDTLYVNNTPINSAAAVNCSSDGVYLYYLDQSGTIHRLTLNSALATEGDYILYSQMQYMGPWYDNYLPIIDMQFNIKALSTYLDTEFSYPLNEAFEIMAYQSAIDYKRKAEGDTTQLEQRLNSIWARFDFVLNRDSGKPERRIADSNYSSTPWFY